MSIELKCYPNGKHKALTMSYDDGRIFDAQLVELFNTYGIKGTFHLNAGYLDREGYVKSNEVNALYQGHEVSCHTLTHPFLTQLPPVMANNEIITDKMKLEKLVGYPVRGMSYPFGDYNKQILSALLGLGMEYARTTCSTNGWSVPKDFLQWHPTCHHNAGISEKAKDFRALPLWVPLALFYIWGHSYEFNDQKNWNVMEDFCKTVSGDPDIWFATNIEVVDYIHALTSLKISFDQKSFFNPSSQSVWVLADGVPLEIKPGYSAV